MCSILAQVATYLLEDPEELRGLKAFLELSFCSFLLLLFFGEVSPYKENKQDSLGKRRAEAYLMGGRGGH